MKIEHVIDDTSKEIYEFKFTNISWEYVGIMYSNRNDANDIWGDEWSEHFADKRRDEINAIASELGLCSLEEMTEWDWEANGYHFSEVENHYNPCCQKTIHGETRCHGSYGGRHGHPTPKISIDEIKAEILKQVSEMKIEL